MLLEQVEAYLREFIAPHAAEIDEDPKALQTAFRGLGERSWLALRLPEEWGVWNATAETYGLFQELIARYSGALAFLQTQHQTAAALLLQSENEALKQMYLPRMSRGEIELGVGFSQLRRQGCPPMGAQALPGGGYQLEGQIPWITGFGCFDEFLIGATLPDGRAVFGIVPFKNTQQSEQAKGVSLSAVAEGSIRFSEPLSLASMASTNTVTAELTRWFLSQDRVVFVRPADWMQKNDRRSVLRPIFLPLGCARAGLDILAAASRTKTQSFIADAYDALDRELVNCRTAVLETQKHPDTSSFGHQVHLRAWAIDLAVRCAHAAIAASSGAANHKQHGAQRVYREALVFTVSGQTTASMEATLAQLTRS